MESFGYKQLDQLRENINHDFIRNAFLNKLGTARTDKDVNERSADIRVVWENIEGSTDDEVVQAKKETVYQGLANWPGVRKKIRNFFESAPSANGYRGKKRFQDAYAEFFSGDRSIVATINLFVSDFEKLSQVSEEVVNERLIEFWQAADRMQAIFSEMRPGMDKGAYFGEYFEKE